MTLNLHFQVYHIFIFVIKLTPIHLYRIPDIFSCPVIDDLRGDVDVDLLTNYSLLSRVRSLDLTRVMPAGCQPALRLNCLHFTRMIII